MKQEQIDPEMEQLAKMIKKVEKPSLSLDRKELLKNQIMEKAPRSILVYLKDVVSDIVLSPDRKALLKERIMAVIESHSQKKFFWGNFFAFQKRLVGAMVVFAMGLGFFSFMNVDMGVVHAETFTTLSDFSGDVSVERNGKQIEIERGMRIYEKDRVSTGEDGSASIMFFDDSVSRLSSETDVSVSKLVRPDDSYSKSYVEVSLENGEMWSRVVNLVEKNSAFVVATDDAKTLTKKAAFNVSVEEDSVEVEVFNHEVEFETSVAFETVVSGRKVKSTKDRVVVSDLDENDKEVAWAKENIDSDKLYLNEVEERLLVAKMESVGVDVDEEFDYKTSLTEEAVVFLTFGDVKKKKKELDLAEKAFVSAEVRLNDPNATEEEKVEAQSIIITFKETVQAFDLLVNDVRSTDSEYAEELQAYVSEKLDNQKKSLSLALPGDPSYFAKEVIEDLEIEFVDDEKELIEKKVEHGLNKIAEAEDLIDQGGDVDLVKDLVEEGKEEVEDVADMVKSLEKTEERDVIRELNQEVEKNLVRADNVEEKVFDIEYENLPVLVEDVFTPIEVVPEVRVDETYGVQIEGDRPLDPLLY